MACIFDRISREGCQFSARIGKRLVGIVALGDFAIEVSDIDIAGEALSEISKPD